MLMGFTPYSRDKTFVFVRQTMPLLIFVAAGSVVGTFVVAGC